MPLLRAVRTDGWDIEPFADRSAAFVFVRDPVAVKILDKVSWYVLEICNGKTPQEIEEQFARVLGERRQELGGTLVGKALDTLRGHHLIDLEEV